MTTKKKTKRKTPKKNLPRNNWTMTEAMFRGYIISALRKASMWWKPKQEVLGEARVERGKYKCAACWEVWPKSLPPLPWKKRKRNNAQLDHIVPVIDPLKWFESYDKWIERCFVEKEWWQVLCRECHYNKTQEEKKQKAP